MGVSLSVYLVTRQSMTSDFAPSAAPQWVTEHMP